MQLRALALAVASALSVAGSIFLLTQEPDRSGESLIPDEGKILVLGPRSSVLVPADTIPDRVLEVFLEEGKPHLHTSSEPDHLKDELAFMEEYADASLSNISTELEAFKPVMTEKLEGYLDSKIARGNGQRLVPDEDGRVGVSTGMLGDSPYFGTGDVTWPDGSTLLATHEEGEDPELDALVARVEWLKWRQRMLALEQREPGR